MNASQQEVIAYFEGTRWDYRHLWRSEKAGALHFGYYDANTRNHVDALRRMTTHLASLVGITATDRVLDAGCGLGGCAIRLVQRFGCRVTGVNITPFQVTAATEAASAAGVGDAVDITQADITDTGLPDGSHSVIWALESVVHVEDKDAFLREAYRVLEPGGRLMIAEYLVRESPPLNATDAADLRTWCRGWAMPGLLTESEYRRRLAASGFEDVQVFDLSRNVAPSLQRLRRLIRLLNPTAPAFRLLRVLGKVPADNLQASAAQVRLFRSGGWTYDVVLARKPGGTPAEDDTAAVPPGL